MKAKPKTLAKYPSILCWDYHGLVLSQESFRRIKQSFFRSIVDLWVAIKNSETGNSHGLVECMQRQLLHFELEITGLETPLLDGWLSLKHLHPNIVLMRDWAIIYRTVLQLMSFSALSFTPSLTRGLDSAHSKRRLDSSTWFTANFMALEGWERKGRELHCP